MELVLQQTTASSCLYTVRSHPPLLVVSSLDQEMEHSSKGTLILKRNTHRKEYSSKETLIKRKMKLIKWNTHQKEMERSEQKQGTT